MKSEWKKSEGNTGELTVTFQDEEWTKELGRQLRKAAATIEIAGFRRGKAPLQIAKKYINEAYLHQEALDALLKANYPALLDEHQIEPIAQPVLDVKETDQDHITFTLTIEVKPEITLGQYKNLGITKEEVTVSDEEMNGELERLQNENAEIAVKDGAVADKDIVTIDFTGYVDGEAFEGGSATDYKLTVGSGEFVPGFEEQLIGLNVNDAKDVTVTFPSDYGEESLRDKEAVFKVVVKGIENRVLPPLEELVEDLNYDGVSDVEGLKEHVKSGILKNKQDAADEEYLSRIYEKLIENTPIDVPEAMITSELERIVSDYQQRLEQNQLSLTTYLKLMNKTPEEFKNDLRPEAESRVKLNLIFEAIVKAENLTCSDEEIDVEIERIIGGYEGDDEGDNKQRMREILKGMSADIANDLLTRKVLDIVESQAE